MSYHITLPLMLLVSFNLNRLEEVSKKLFAFKSKADENRIDFVHHSLKLSEKTDELNDKINKIKQMLVFY